MRLNKAICILFLVIILLNVFTLFSMAKCSISEKYSMDSTGKYILDVKGYTTLRQFRKNTNLIQIYKKIKFPDYGDDVNEDLEYVKTGDKVEIKGTSYIIVVLGDIDKDGKSTYKDILIEKELVEKKYSDRYNPYELSDELTRIAADINHDGKVNRKDLNLIVNQNVPNRVNDGVENPNPGGNIFSSSWNLPGNETANDTQSKIVLIAKNYSSYGIVPRSGRCLQWVEEVYVAAGFPSATGCCASCSGYNYGVSNDWSKIVVGAAVYGQYTSSNPYGHVGIYIGDGIVIHNLSGKVKQDNLEDWVRKYNGKCWGWPPNGAAISGYPITKGLCAKGNHR